MSADTFTTSQVADIYKVSESTIRNWATEFESYLSAYANSAQGRARQYNMDDMEVFALISELKQAGRAHPDIHASLANGERGTVPDIPATSLLSPQILMREVQRLTTTLEDIQQERDTYKTQVDDLRLQVARLETEIRILREQSGQAVELGKALGELEALRKMMDKKGEG